MEIPFDLLATIQICWIVSGLIWFLRRNDEVPLFTTLMVVYFSSYRYWAVQQDFTGWCNLTNFGFAQITDAMALAALRLIVLGESVLLTTYYFVQRRSFRPVRGLLAPAVCGKMKGWLWGGALVVIVLSVGIKTYVAIQEGSGLSASYDVSAYLYLFPLVLTTIAVLLMLLIRFGSISSAERLFSVALLLAIFWSSYETQGRFKFVAWLVAGALIFTSPLIAWKRLFFLVVGLAAAVAAFSLAGSQRSLSDDAEFSIAGMPLSADPDAVGATDQEKTLIQFRKAEDANMLDGMVFLMNTVPDVVPYSYGGGHLAILYRPIPRAIWPGKPVKNWMLQAAGLDEDRGFTIGISPSLFGDLYLEGGVITMVLLSVVYGVLLGRISRWGAGLHPFVGLIIRCLICSSLVLLLRGGDLPGILAWLMMSYWPLLPILLFRRNYLKPGSPWFIDPPRQAAFQAHRRQAWKVPAAGPAPSPSGLAPGAIGGTNAPTKPGKS